MSKLTRRAWLKRAASLCAGYLPSSRAFAAPREEPAISLPFGFSLYGMKGLKTAEALRECAAIGYDAVELVLMPGWPTEPKLLTADDRRELRQRLGDTGLALAGLMENLVEPSEDAAHRANRDRLKAAAELGHALSPKTPPVIETILGGKPGQWEQVKDRLAARLRSWAEVAAAAKTVIAIKPHVGNALHTPEGAKWLRQQIDSPWLKLAFDFSHFVLRDLPLAKTMAALLPDSIFIHVKDAKGNAEKFEFLLPGDGGIDYADYFQSVRTAGYRGPVVVEVSGQISGKPGYDPIAAAKRSYANLAPVMKKEGVRSK